MNSNWLDAIPPTWTRKKLKHVVQLMADRAESRPDGMPYVGLENIESHTGRVIQAQHEEDGREPDGTSTVNLFQRGDLLFGKLRPYLAKGWHCEFDGACTTEALVLRPVLGIDPTYLLTVILSQDFVREVDTTTFGSKMPRADWGSIGNLEVPVPSLEEQKEIVAVLGRQVDSLDQLLVEKRRLLQFLAEKRRTMITQTVTQGLDVNALRRDSGTPWLGEIPAHWDVWRVGHFATVGNGSTPFRDNGSYWKDGWIPWLNSAATNVSVVTAASQFVTDQAVAECHLPMVQPGSVLIAITGQGKTRGQAALLKIEATINQHLAYVSPKSDVIDSEFLHAWFAGNYEFLRSISDDTGGTKGALTCEQISGLRLALPTKNEQQEIAEYLSIELPKVDDLVLSAESTIGLLLERRFALIAEAVTGQLG